ncbi:MAG: thiamine/thiamine pyrophosphate ABC transporter permease ThiP [Rhizobiaceae bacterium]
MKGHPGGLVAAAFLALVSSGALFGLILPALRAPDNLVGQIDGYLLRVATFTLWQATLSTLLSVIPAIFIARAIFRLGDFPGRRIVLALHALPLALPAIAVVLALIALLGRSGVAGWWVNQWGLGAWNGIFGLEGILIAHVFFNMPLAVRLFLEALQSIPEQNWRIGAQLGLRAGSLFRIVEWPRLRTALPGIAGLVFLLCATSFTIVLTLGGGPRATTLEVAIYQSLRFDFDPARAAALTLVQLLLAGLVVFLLARIASPATEGRDSLSRAVWTPRLGFSGLVLAMMLVACSTLYVTAPVAAIAWRGLQADLLKLLGEKAFHGALATSLVVGLLSASISVLLGFLLLRANLANAGSGARAGLSGLLASGASNAVLALSPIVLGAGWFVLLAGTGQMRVAAPVVLVGVNAMMALPFVLRTLRPAHDRYFSQHERLARSLAIGGWNRFRLLDLPVLIRAIMGAFAFAMALSLGDLGAIALFGSSDLQTLPWLLYARMGSYRTHDAAGLALILSVLVLMLMWAGTKGVEHER